MGWTAVSSGGAYDPFHKDIAGEYFNAYNERRFAVHGTTGAAGSFPAAGVDAHNFANWKYLQEYADGACTNWVDSHSGGAKRSSTYYDGRDTIDNYADVATFHSAAGMASGWRRKTTVGGGFSYGYIQAGDIFGSWIYEDLQTAYNALIWKVYSGSWGNTWSNNDIWRSLASGIVGWAAFVAAVAANWAALGGSDPANLSPVSYFRANEFVSTPGKYTSNTTNAIRAQLRLSGVSVLYARKLDFYVYTETGGAAGNWTYGTNGLDVIEDKWSLYEYDKTHAVGNPLSSMLGDLAVPTAASVPTAPVTENRGWVSNGGKCIVRWTGFTYQA